MKKIITESQIRFVVRNELKNYLVQEGLWDTIKKGATETGAKLSTAIKQTGQQIAEPWKSSQVSTQIGEINNIIKKISEDTGKQISADFVGQIYNILFKKENNKYVYAADSGTETDDFVALMTRFSNEYANNIDAIETEAESSEYALREAAAETTVTPAASVTSEEPVNAVAKAKKQFSKHIAGIDSLIAVAKTKKQVKKLLLFSLLKYFIQICVVSFLSASERASVILLANTFKDHVEKLKESATTSASTTPSAGTSPSTST